VNEKISQSNETRGYRAREKGKNTPRDKNLALGTIPHKIRAL
jgi:hypothetical protein